MPGATREEFELLDTSLRPQRVRLVGLGDGQVSYFDQDRRLDRRDLNDLLRLTFHRFEERPRALIELADGQKLDGQFAGVDEQGRVVWNSMACGKLIFELDQIAWFVLPERGGETPAGSKAPATDRITLSNGDALEGWVENLGSAVMKLNHSGQMLELGWDQISRVELANPRRRPAGSYVSLSSGSLLRMDQPAIEGGWLSGGVLGSQRRWLLDQVAALDLVGRYRLIPLWELNHEVTEGGEVLGVKWEYPVKGGRWHLHAPLTLRFDLPAGTRRLALRGVLEGGEWSDLVVRLREGDREWLNQPVRGAGTGIQVNIEPVARQGGRIELSILEGANGPIQDRLVLEEAVLLVEEKPAAGSPGPGRR